MKQFVALYLSFMLVITVIAGATGGFGSRKDSYGDDAENNTGDGGKLWWDEAVTERTPSEGLEFLPNDDGYSYAVTWIGSCTDSNLVIPSEYNGYPVTKIGMGAFVTADQLETVYIPGSVKTIEDEAFGACSNLYRVEMDYGVESIATLAFYGCASLSEVVIPSSVTSVGVNAFLECDRLYGNEYNGCYYLGSEKNPYYLLYRVGDNIPSCLYLHSDLHVIAAGAFSYRDDLTELNAADSLEYIGESAFEGCWNLNFVYCGMSLKRIEDGAFFECENLAYIYLGGSLREIGMNAFGGCVSLTECALPYSLEAIGAYAFVNCASLSFAELGPLMTTIEEGVFSGCSTLDTVYIHGDVTYVAPYAFYLCESLTSIALPESLEWIGDYAFAECYSLWQISYGSTMSQWRNNVSLGTHWWTNYSSYGMYVQCTDYTLSVS